MHNTDTSSTILPTASSEASRYALDSSIEYLKTNTSSRPNIGIICGSGLSGLSKCLSKQQVFQYADIPGFPQSTVPGHAGELVFGELEQHQVVCMRGRFHTYEGYDPQTVALPVRVMKSLGVQVLLITNAAGGLHPDYEVGDLMIMNDHLNMPGLAGKHPLVGPNDERYGERFTPLSDCYDQTLQQIAWLSALQSNLTHKVRQGGVYCFVSGPTYETPAECQYLRMIGADAVGMSTVPEAIVARHCGMRVFGMSLITNKAVMPGSSAPPACHAEVLETVEKTQSEIESLVQLLILNIQKYATNERQLLTEIELAKEATRKGLPGFFNTLKSFFSS